MKKLLIALSLIAVVSCSKDNKENCYECDTNVVFANDYQDYGCYTNEQWNNFLITDNQGNELDKNTRCRKK